jgi:hypothetical protein
MVDAYPSVAAEKAGIGRKRGVGLLAKPLTRSQQVELLMHEYDAISEQIIHFDSQFWTMSQFFVAVEAVSLGVVAQWLLPALQAGAQGNAAVPHSAAAAAVCMAGGVNLFLSYSWFRTGRSQLEYTGARFERARQLEDERVLDHRLRLYHTADAYLHQPCLANHGSRWWVRHVPSAFVLSWLAVLATGALIALSQSAVVWPEVIAPAAVAAVALVMILLAEFRGWPVGSRGRAYREHHDID